MTSQSDLKSPRGWSGRRAAFTILMFLAGGCMSTPKVVESWKDPSVTGPLRFKKILVIAIHPDRTARHDAEAELVRQIGPDRTIPGEQVLTDADRRDPEKLKATIKQSGADGVVVISIEGTTTDTSAMPSQQASNPYSYDAVWHNYDRDMSTDDVSDSAMSRRTILIRTRIYSVADEKLLWSGVSSSFDPKDAKSLVTDVVKAVGKRLREEHLIE